MILKFIKLMLIAIVVLLALFAMFVAVTLIVDQPRAAVAVVVPLSIVVFLGGAFWSMAESAGRRRRGAAVLGYIEQAVRLNLPLPRLVRAIGESERGKLARELDIARQRLEQGESLATVLQVIPSLPPRVIGLVAAAERTGRLPQVLSRLVEQRRRAIARGVELTSFYRTYPLILGLAFIAVTSLIMVFVMPKFEQIFKDFGIQLPGITVAMLQLYRVAWPWIPLLLAILFIALIVNTISSRWMGTGYGMVERPLARLAGYLPWIGRVRMQRALGDVLDCAADAVEAGRPIEMSLTEAGQVCGNARLRQRVDRWANLLAQGQPLPAAATAPACRRWSVACLPLRCKRRMWPRSFGSCRVITRRVSAARSRFSKRRSRRSSQSAWGSWSRGWR